MKIKRYDKSNKIEEEMGFEFDKLELIGHINMYFDVLIYRYKQDTFLFEIDTNVILSYFWFFINIYLKKEEENLYYFPLF